MMEFAEVLPTIRQTVNEHMGRRGLPREKVLATVVHLLEKTLIRIGNDDYARSNGSFGLTTLKSRHAVVNGSEVRFEFIGKGGKKWSVAMTDRRVAKVIKACQELPGQELLQYIDEDGCRRHVSSADINGYLRNISGRDVTAKDFRTFGGSVMAALALHEVGPASSATGAKKNVRAAIERVAARLGNTPTICRKCYVHPDIVDAYLEGNWRLRIAQTGGRTGCFGLTAQEGAVIAALRLRTKRRANGRVIREQRKAA
jgi:DNA topoisomerase-1